MLQRVPARPCHALVGSPRPLLRTQSFCGMLAIELICFGWRAARRWHVLLSSHNPVESICCHILPNSRRAIELTCSICWHVVPVSWSIHNIPNGAHCCISVFVKYEIAGVLIQSKS